MAWFDQHCHIPAGADGIEWHAEACAAGVDRMITVGTSIERSLEAIEVAAALDGVWATAGVHPHDAVDGLEGLSDLLDNPGVVAVGECGLDFHYDHSPRPLQEQVFAAQVAMANERDLPLVIHTREAWHETFAILDREGTPARTVFHCFTGGPDEGRECLERGALLSFSGIVTFPNAPELREAAAACPVERLLVETDSPYLAPVPHRGRKNRPALVPYVGAAVADAKGVAVEVIEQTTWQTASAFYGLESEQR